MNEAIKNLMSAMHRAMENRPKVGGFPYLAECLRSAGVAKNVWNLPSCQSLYLTEKGQVVIQGSPIINGSSEVPPFDKDALIQALRTNQAGESTFPEFLLATWKAGIIRYEVDFSKRVVSYYGCFEKTEVYVEVYPAVKI